MLLRSGFTVLLLATVAACSSDGAGGSSGSGGSAAEGGSGGTGAAGSGGSGGSGGSCIDPGTEGEMDTGWTPQVPASMDSPMDGGDRPGDCGARYGFIAAARGWAAAPGGKPLCDVYGQICIHNSGGNYVCVQPQPAEADGVFTRDIPTQLQCVDKATIRVFAAAASRASFYCHVDKYAGPSLKMTDPAVLPSVPAPASLPPAGDDSVRAVTIDDGLVLQVKPSLFRTTGSYEKLAGRRIDPHAVGLCSDTTAMNFDGIYAFHPEDDLAPPKFAFTIPNKTGLAANATVELFVQGSIACTLPDASTVAEGVWTKFGEGTVSPDGTTITPGPGVVLPCLNWLGYRLKP